MPRAATRVIAFATALVALPVTAAAQSTDPQARPRMLAEGAQITDVVDALDVGSVWSFRFTAGFVRSQRNARLQRERSTITTGMNPAPAPGGFTEFDNIGRFTQITQTLNVGAEIALFHDLALTFGLPIILSDSREIASPEPQANMRLQDGYSNMGTPTQLFSVPFQSPERSGIDQVRIGLSWNILNQLRDPHFPTWLVRFEWRPPVGAQLRPCSVEMGMTRCPVAGAEAPPRPGEDPADYMPAGSTNVNVPPEAFRRMAGPAQPGISRRLHGLYIQTVVARRVGYVEPYFGLDALFEIPERNEFFRFGDTPFGQLANFPPIRGSLTAGVEIVPWENRETWQRFVVDLRVRGQYNSQGRDYTPLFDALGSSDSIPLSSASYNIMDQRAMAQGGGIDRMRRGVFFSGTTGVHSNGQLTAQISIAIQAARFLRFSFGYAFTYTTPFLMTATDACNPNVQPENPALRGGCTGNAVPDPMHRPVIDAPGQRFRMVEDMTHDAFVNVALTPRF